MVFITDDKKIEDQLNDQELSKNEPSILKNVANESNSTLPDNDVLLNQL